MVERINFVRDRQRQLTKQEIQDRQWFRYGVMVFAAIAVVALVSVAISVATQYLISNTRTTQAALKEQISSQQEIERSYIIFAHKLKVLATLFDQRSNKQEAIRYFASAFGSDVLIREIQFQADQGLVRFGLEAQTIFVLQRVFDQLDSAAVREQFPQLSRSELRRAADGSYQMLVTVELPKASQAQQRR